MTYPDSNTLWQRDLETDVSCHWHGADEEMVSRVHAVYLSVRTEGGREGEWMLDWRCWRKKGGAVAGSGGGGCGGL